MPLLPPVMTATLPSNFFDVGLPPLPVRDVRVKGCKSDCLPRGIRPTGSRRLYQAEQAMRDDLPRLLDQFVKDLTGRLDLADQTHPLARQQIHRIDVASPFGGNPMKRSTGIAWPPITVWPTAGSSRRDSWPRASRPSHCSTKAVRSVRCGALGQPWPNRMVRTVPPSSASSSRCL